MSQTDYDFVFKIVIIGNSSVGKSSLLLRFADDVFHDTFLPTIGVDFKIRTIEQAGSVVKLQMWDTAGQEKFKTIVSAYYKGAQGIMFVFDLTDPKSFSDVKSWMAEAERFSHDKVVKILVGNKSDMENERMIRREDAQQFADSEGMLYYETSAKTNYNVETLFKTFSGKMKETFSKAYIEKYKTTKTCLMPVKPPVGTSRKNKSCC